MELDMLDIVAITAVLGVALYFLIAKFASSNTRPVTVPSSSSTSATSMFDDNFVNKMEAMKARMVIFFGSQTGTAEDFATRIAQEARKYGIRALVADIEDYDMENLTRMKELEEPALAVFCVATYGEGDPTDNAQEFFDNVNNMVDMESGWDLQGMHYSVFGLGNKTYEHFNAMAKWLDKSLSGFGATRVGELGLGDDDANLEEDFMNWQDTFWNQACDYLGISSDGSGVSIRQYKLELHNDLPENKIFTGEHGKLLSYKNQKRPFSSKNPYLAPMAVKRELYQDPERSCLHIEVDIKQSGLRYAAGDHIAVYPVNNSRLVERLAELLSVDLDQVFSLLAADEYVKKKMPFPCPCSYRTALTHYVDLTHQPGLNVLQEMIQYVSDDKEKEMLQRMVSKEGRSEYRKWVHEDQRSIIHVLEDLPSVKIPIDHLLELLPRLQPRYYSISSSPKLHSDTVHITAAVVRYDTPTGRHVEGVATTWFERLQAEQDTMPVYVRPSKFRLPNKHKKPVIMIGPGTGIAPFRGFIQERAYAKEQGEEIGETVLFFGCQNESKHFMYREELDKYCNDGVLTIFTAFSRDQPQKVYVQHRLRENAAFVWKLLQNEGYVYVCGDAKHMARDVHHALVEIICKEGGKTEQDAENVLKTMETKRRYQQDVWS